MKRHVSTALLISIALLFAGFVYGQDDLSSREVVARKTAKGFLEELASALQKEMAAGGPVRAVGVCSDLAPSITGKISRETGWKVSRVSMKVRNPLLGMPDVWEQNVLPDFEKRTSNGEDFDTMSYSEVVSEACGKFFPYMKAVAIKQPCLACHGSEKQISSQVHAILNERYPHDRAKGHPICNLRGAISIKEPL